MRSIIIVLVMAALAADVAAAGTVTVWPAPEGEELSQDFSVTVEGETRPSISPAWHRRNRHCAGRRWTTRPTRPTTSRTPPSRLSTCRARWRWSSLVPSGYLGPHSPVIAEDRSPRRRSSRQHHDDGATALDAGGERRLGALAAHSGQSSRAGSAAQGRPRRDLLSVRAFTK